MFNRKVSEFKFATAHTRNHYHILGQDILISA